MSIQKRFELAKQLKQLQAEAGAGTLTGFQSEQFDKLITSIEPGKIDMIKDLRATYGLSLRDSKIVAETIIDMVRPSVCDDNLSPVKNGERVYYPESNIS